MGEFGEHLRLALGGRLPFLVQGFAGSAEVGVLLEVQGQLALGLPAAQQQRTGEGFEDAPALVGDEDGHAGLVGDVPVLLDEDLQDETVDAGVGVVDGDLADAAARLAEAVDAARALEVAGRVPRQVVVDDGAEVVLEVDALGEAVGGDQHVSAAPGGEFVHPGLAGVGVKGAGNRLDAALRPSSS
ncbi:hypothetical protein [Streptomyces sp. BPTC-684]|uniref:hypothetical protein n=1 Tax=Streptomyces sp. BPTC-684 TaxID=3043734 RepID=UPI0024B1C3B6|nr:hypothetical protein [Streptomyces sp. BPTC-684]WHM39393.1 hypothetical protein QIY60_22605 [Streptomyces sp. BPTC-684]